MSFGSTVLQRFISWMAHSQGFLDPIELFGRLRRFGRPAEVMAPTELLRAGAVLHARGLINSQAIQHNLDWVWPYWVVRQFDPQDAAFVPRAFSLTHINLTHRNWTAIGLPDVPELPIVDPRGLLTPHYDGWSLDGWVISDDHGRLLPSQLQTATQQLRWTPQLEIVTTLQAGPLTLTTTASVVPADDRRAVCRWRLEATAPGPAWLAVALRPYNPEGISLISHVTLDPERTGWLVNRKWPIRWDAPAERVAFSRYSTGDVIDQLPFAGQSDSVECDVGLATAAVLFAIPPGGARSVTVELPLGPHPGEEGRAQSVAAEARWEHALSGQCQLQIPDARWQFLFDASVRTIVLHAPGDIYPGPYTYKRFWFRDAAFIIHALLCLGLVERAERALDRFPSRQTVAGYFHSQQGEWDSNGQALWILHRFCQLTARAPHPAWQHPIHKAARWIQRKRLPESPPSPHAGLLPPGFSAEHFGPNEFYYWDDFWAVAGLRGAAAMVRDPKHPAPAQAFRDEADALMRCIDRSLESVHQRLGHIAAPVSPYRRMDAGAIGMMVAGYPLQLWAPDDPRLQATTEFLLRRCLVDGAFFQNINHSGLNPYLTLHIAQVLLRAGDPRWHQLVERIAQLASPTGQWPEAVHPRTGGGCMGDGQHVWASAEWVLMMRQCFIAEEGADRVVLGQGIPSAWLHQPEPISFGPTLTPFGKLAVTVEPHPDAPRLTWAGHWHGRPPRIEARLPGYEPVLANPSQSSVTLDRR